jgi:hypothetical protein
MKHTLSIVALGLLILGVSGCLYALYLFSRAVPYIPNSAIITPKEGVIAFAIFFYHFVLATFVFALRLALDELDVIREKMAGITPSAGPADETPPATDAAAGQPQ